MGRYASVVGTELSGYRLVQDTRFDRGASEGTRRAGRAAPVETHVFVDTPAGPEFGRKVLDVSEQSCYLHAPCRSEMEPDVRVGGA